MYNQWKPVLIKFPLFHSEDFYIFLKDVLFTKNACIWFKKKTHTHKWILWILLQF